MLIVTIIYYTLTVNSMSVLRVNFAHTTVIPICIRQRNTVEQSVRLDLQQRSNRKNHEQRGRPLSEKWELSYEEPRVVGTTVNWKGRAEKCWKLKESSLPSPHPSDLSTGNDQSSPENVKRFRVWMMKFLGKLRVSDFEKIYLINCTL